MLFDDLTFSESEMVLIAKEILVSRTLLRFFRTKYIRFKGNKSRYVQKSILYLFNV